MTDFIPLKEYGQHLELKKGDFIFVSSDTRRMLLDALRHKSSADLNDLIDGLLEAVGSDGTVVFPCYNWDFCKGLRFDYKNTPCKTGTIGTVALSRSDFVRTKHPIYSFAVAGRYRNELLALENTSSFGNNSPFAFFHQHQAVNIMFDISLKGCFTYIHYVQEQSGDTSNRYLKNFTSEYTDERGVTSTRTYSMFVRKLELDVVNTVDPLEDDFKKAGCISYLHINSSNVKKVDLAKCYDVVLNDIRFNRSRKICT
ncbi:MAG: AAC(3) family N-acetyltransferase, partial [Succinivibrio sp.]